MVSELSANRLSMAVERASGDLLGEPAEAVDASGSPRRRSRRGSPTRPRCPRSCRRARLQDDPAGVAARWWSRGSTESSVDIRKVPPSMMSASLLRTLLAHAELFLDELQSWRCRPAPACRRRWPSSSARLTGTVVLPCATTLPSARYGPRRCRRRSRCTAHPPRDSPDTRTSLDVGSCRRRVDGRTTAFTPSGDDRQLRHPADRHAAQRDVLIGQQTTGLRQFHRHPVGGLRTGSPAAHREQVRVDTTN